MDGIEGHLWSLKHKGEDLWAEVENAVKPLRSASQEV